MEQRPLINVKLLMRDVVHAVLLLVLMASSCGCCKSVATTRPTDALAQLDHKMGSNSAPPVEIKKGDPVVALWDCGIYLLGVKPSILFAVWADGTVVRAAEGRLMVGKVKPDAVAKLLTEIERSGFRNPHLESGILHPDGPVERLSVTFDGKAAQLFYDGSTDFNDLGPDAIPSRAQLEAFVRMWREVQVAIADVKPAEVTELRGDLAPTYQGH